ncbi:MAG: protein-methionine-sulfoxide reductase heme-binding subunit MsrQ [Pseudomonadota bacterium]|nr:protein-methionine-sulfoxide reductase heme-binding subunit MsrQ [Pseudomonadota bacterium]
MLRFVVHFGAFLPLVWLGYLVLSGEIGADPAERLVRELGFYGACSLWASLSLTPLRILTGVPQWVAYRRALGLWAFAYISLHLAAFISVWAGFDWGIVMEEVTQRPYIYVGLLAWLLMVPLALTSTRAARRSLGRRWGLLHKLVYLVAVLGMLHMVWIAKLDYLQVTLFFLALALLFAIRWRLGRK